MTDQELDDIFARYGVDSRLIDGPENTVLVEAALTSAGAPAQTDILHQLAAMRATLELMEVTIRDRPFDDKTFDVFDQTLSRQLAEAADALRRLRARRDCQGAA